LIAAAASTPTLGGSRPDPGEQFLDAERFGT